MHPGTQNRLNAGREKAELARLTPECASWAQSISGLSCGEWCAANGFGAQHHQKTHTKTGQRRSYRQKAWFEQKIAFGM